MVVRLWSALALPAAMIMCGLVVMPRTRSPEPAGVAGPPVQARLQHESGSHATQGAYVVHELDTFAKRFWARVAGEDTALGPHTNGHDEFAALWTRLMLENLHGLHAGEYRQYFSTPGFRGLPASRPGVNVAIIVPGSRHADQSVVVGAHYDGEPDSRGSAYDDTSGCALLLGLARVLGAHWRARGNPSRTVEFILFDGEEQGLVGSNAFGFDYRRGAIMPRPVIMIDEEQSGVGYPVRPFGLVDRQPIASYATTTAPVHFTWLGPVIGPNRAGLAVLRARLIAARRSVFSDLHARVPTVSFRGGSAPVFTAQDRHFLKIGTNPICCSDNAPFEELGLPTVTFSGDFRFYDRGAPAWAFPFDQPEDTPRALACDTGGNSAPSLSLVAALALPLELSQVIVDDYAPAARGAGVVVMSSPAGVGGVARFAAIGAPSVRWQFGDGTSAAGATAVHRYRRPGVYGVRVTGTLSTTSWRLVISKRAPVFKDPLHTLFPPPIAAWHPAELDAVPGCH